MAPPRLRSSFLDFAPPQIGDEEVAGVVETLRSDWLTTGPKVDRFESSFAELVGADAALALNSGTAALHLGLAAVGVGPGDLVLTSPISFCSSAHVVEHLGARPLLVDVEPDTLNLDPEEVERVLAGGTAVKAILPVHLYGHPCQMDRITALAEQHRAAVVEDAAHSLPAYFQGRCIGAPVPGSQHPNLVAFSFYATKNLTTGEGGMLTGPANLIEEARVMSLHGMNRDAYRRYTAVGSWRYEVVAAGFKYNMTDIQAAIGLAQLERLRASQKRRREIRDIYDAGLADCDEIIRPVERPDVVHAWHLYVIRLRPESLNIDRGQFIEELRELNIGTSVHFIPIHMLRYYREKYGYGPNDYPRARHAFEQIISLPIYPRMSDDDVHDVVTAIHTIASRHRR